jgi:glycosyltransferase involved in cell wall biosynthesis
VVTQAHDPMRVLLVDTVEDLWGAERVVLELAPRLRARGVELHLLAAHQGPFPEAWAAAGLPLVPTSARRHRSIREDDGGRSARTIVTEGGVALAAAARIARHARRFDVLHSNELFAHLEVAVAGKLGRRPVVLHVHDLVVPGLGRRMLSLAARSAYAVLGAAGPVLTSLGLDGRPNGHVFHPAHDLQHFSPGAADPDVRRELGAREGTVLVGMVGRVDPVKGIDVAIDAVAQLADHPEVHLAIVGGPFEATEDDMARLRAQAERQLGDRISFVGHRPDVVPVLRALDVLVNASRVEPFGTSVAEAQACGRAVVATAVGGVPEHVADGVDGLLVPSEDAGALAAALRRLVEEPDLRQRLGAAGREMMLAHHDIERAADRLADVYRRAVAGRRP